MESRNFRDFRLLRQESEEEAQTLCVKLKDEVTGVVLELLYTILHRVVLWREVRS